VKDFLLYLLARLFELVKFFHNNLFLNSTALTLGGCSHELAMQHFVFALELVACMLQTADLLLLGDDHQLLFIQIGGELPQPLFLREIDSSEALHLLLLFAYKLDVRDKFGAQFCLLFFFGDRPVQLPTKLFAA